MRSDRFDRKRLFQLIAQGRGNPSSLIVFMDVKPVEISRFIDISESHDPAVCEGHEGRMLQKRAVPGSQIDRSRCPCIQLFFCIIFCIYRMYRIIKKDCHLPAVFTFILPYFHDVTPFYPYYIY